MVYVVVITQVLYVYIFVLISIDLRNDKCQYKIIVKFTTAIGGVPPQLRVPVGGVL